MPDSYHAKQILIINCITKQSDIKYIEQNSQILILRSKILLFLQALKNLIIPPNNKISISLPKIIDDNHKTNLSLPVTMPT